MLRTQEKKLHALQDKLASLSFLDPSAGSGNFLTESYLQLRKLENEILRLLTHGQITFGYEGFSPIKVSISQFYGIEINDFAVTVARTALWIAENQMLKETEDIVHMQLDFLPLKTNAYIVEGNALRIDWNDVVDKSKLNYIMGNPPFVGHNLRSNAQKEDISIVFGKGETESKLDYVICWYQKAIEYMEKAVNHITAAFVSTNSICQGESVPAFWKQLVVDHKAEIQFAYSTFIWDSEASSKAHVHCVIVGFTYGSVRKPKKLFDGSDVTEVDHINPYIIAAPDVWLESRTNKPQGSLPKMTTGSQPMDYGNFILDAEERETLVSKYPVLDKYIKPFIGAHEFLHNRIGQYSRYCLWLDKADLSEIRNIPEIKERIERVRQLRTESKIDRVKKKADLPYLFCQIRQPKSTYLVIPRHSSQTRRYIPFGFIQPEIIAGDACTIIPNLGLYEFGILTSNVHMAWVRVVCGRIKSDFRYQASVYNNFPWPQPAEKEKQRIAETAQGILDARSLYSNSCLADLYDPTFMPPELRKAHMDNDRAVMQAYGISVTTFVGQNFGARQYDRVKKCARTGLLMTMVSIVAISVIIFTLCPVFLSIFTNDQAVIEQGTRFLRTISPSYFTFVFVQVYSATIRGCGESVQPTILSLVSICGVRILWLFAVLPFHRTVETVVFSYDVSWAIAGVCYIVYYLKGRWLKRCITRQQKQTQTAKA